MVTISNCMAGTVYQSEGVLRQNSLAIQIPQTFRKHNVDALGLDVNARAELGSERHQHFTSACLDSHQSDATWKLDIANRAHRCVGSCLPHFASNQLADVIISGIELCTLFERNLHLATAQAL